jgi:hypothetical protein
MPNYDAGHYFLTALVPVKLDSVLVDGQSRSRRHAIKGVLDAAPAGETTAGLRGKVIPNPFADSMRTHFARFFVLDDVVFNGRVSCNSLVSTILGIDPLKAQPVDRLSSPFLIFAVDFDAASGADTELKSYLVELWGTMRVKLAQVFQHCVGFDSISDANGFFAYIKKCQIETTMPFNDYWATPPKLSDINLLAYLIAGLAALAAAIVGAFGWQPWLMPAGLLALAAVLLLFIVNLLRKAKAPFPKSPPPGPSSDLPTVLKALFLQRAFTQFAIDAQGLDDQAIYDRFGAFIADNKPQSIGAPTQPPGVVGT